MNQCEVINCARKVSKADHTFCLEHWKAERLGKVRRCTKCQRWYDTGGPLCDACLHPADSDENTTESEPTGLISSTRIGTFFSLSNIKVNLILAELGWIEKYVKGWVPTDRGNALGANVREMRNGTPFVVWPESILRNAALRDSVAEQSAGTAPAFATPSAATPGKSPDKSADFRGKFPAPFRTQDGHMVRSRAEVLIDNWLYMQGLVHAYERRLPIEEECYCDFYLPGGKGVYIEFWGRESDPKYRERMAVKQAIYAKQGLRLIELGDAEIERLDDVLPRMLLRFGIESA
jgi:hypothetical protein